MMQSTFLKVMIVVVAYLALFVLITKSFPTVPSLPPEEEEVDLTMIQTKADVAKWGQKIFFGKGKCALCHALEPSTTARCPILQGIGAHLTREFFYESLTKPAAYIYMDYKASPSKPFAAQMPEINKPPIGLNENELLAVIAFLESVGGEPSIDPSELKITSELGMMQ